MNSIKPFHPLKTNARILLSSVFGPYAQDDDYGSRKINPMELYQNQVTRVQGSFSLRMFHRSFGLSMIQENVDAPCTVLDFPSLDRFIREIRENVYDIVGIGAIAPNVGKVQKMCEAIRQFLPKAAIVIGGHIANMEELSNRKADWLRANNSVSVTVEGHCDQRGTIEYNLALGDRRAHAATVYLTNLGISASRLRTVSYGEERPLDTAKTEIAYAKNRRVHFVIE